jgi:hypothetical protein
VEADGGGVAALGLQANVTKRAAATPQTREKCAPGLTVISLAAIISVALLTPAHSGRIGMVCLVTSDAEVS